MASEILVNTGSGNSLLPNSTKPLPELMLTGDRDLFHSTMTPQLSKHDKMTIG